MNAKPVEWHGGLLYPQKVASDSSGFRLGDGIFETVRTYYGKPFRLRAHISRLLAGADSIGFQNLPDFETVEDEILRTMRYRDSLGSGEEWILRPTFFSEKSGWGFVVHMESWKPRNYLNDNDMVSVGISQYPHPERYLVPPSSDRQVKWLARGPLSHALRDARKRGWEEALLMNSNREVVEGTRSNVFAAVDGSVIAPGKKSGAFPGITRDLVGKCALERGMKITDRPISLQELQITEELFITSTLLGVASVGKVLIGEHEYEKTRGEISKMLISDFNRTVMEECHSETTG